MKKIVNSTMTKIIQPLKDTMHPLSFLSFVFCGLSFFGVFAAVLSPGFQPLYAGENQVVDSILQEYRWAMAVETNGDSDFYRMLLPPEVYLGVVSRQWDDVAMFNAKGERILFALEKPQMETNLKEFAAPIFPIYPIKQNRRDNITVQVTQKQNAGGGSSSDALVQIETTEEKRRGMPESYIIDLSEINGVVSGLNIRLAGSGAGTPAIRAIRLEGANDLSGWRAVGGPYYLYDLQHGGRKVQKSAIEANLSGLKYARISSAHETQLDYRIEAVYAQVTETGLPRLQWIRGEAYQKPGDLNREEKLKNIIYLPGQIPVEKIRLSGIPVNRGFDVTAFAMQEPPPEGGLSSDEKEKNDMQWKTVSYDFLYHLKSGPQIVLYNEMEFLPAQYSYWRIRGDRYFQAGEVEFGWKPHLLTFAGSAGLRQEGQETYYLAFGKESAEPKQNNGNGSGLARMIEAAQKKRQIKVTYQTANAGKLFGREGKTLFSPQEEGAPMKVVLWASLCVAMLLLLGVARSIYRQLHVDSPRS